MDGLSGALPTDTEEFRRAAGSILVQLYESWPVPTCIDPLVVAGTLARTDGVSGATLLGMTLDEFLLSTILWLRDEGYLCVEGDAPWGPLSLSGKSLLALNLTRPGLAETVGERLCEAVRLGTWCWDDLGGLFGGAVKTSRAYTLRPDPFSGTTGAT